MDTALGLFELFFYVLAVLALSMGLTWIVIKVSPSESAKGPQAKPDANG